MTFSCNGCSHYNKKRQRCDKLKKKIKEVESKECTGYAYGTLASSSCPICHKTLNFNDTCPDKECGYNDDSFMNKWANLEFIDYDPLDYGDR